tara:strand:+ start:1021 stop:1269 length:249 start_codon:yes stop_codon:yes gene_type:complete
MTKKTITSEQVDRWRIVPRLFICLYGLAFFRATEWFMALPEPTNAQSAYISVIVGAGAAWFGLYVSSGKSSVKTETETQVKE